MKKMNLFTVVMSSLLMTFGLATSAMAGAIIDTDGDLIPDAFDNCTEVANGQAPGGTCSNQIDDNGDGYGNICDADLDNDGIVAFADFQILVAAIGDPAGPVGIDLDCDGIVAFADFQILVGAIGDPPGPKGFLP